MFSSGSRSSISFATVTPSLVIVGDPNFLSRMTFRPLGPSVTLTALARLLTPLRTACRDASPYVICFAIMCSVDSASVRSRQSRRRLFPRTDLLDREDVLLFHDQVLHALELDFLTGVLAEQDRIAGLHVQRHSLAIVLGLAVSGGDHRAVLRLLLRGIG